MTQIIPHGELLQRALEYINQRLTEDCSHSEHAKRKLMDILDQAGMRFNLTPLDMETLQRIFAQEKPEKL